MSYTECFVYISTSCQYQDKCRTVLWKVNNKFERIWILYISTEGAKMGMSGDTPTVIQLIEVLYLYIKYRFKSTDMSSQLNHVLSHFRTSHVFVPYFFLTCCHVYEWLQTGFGLMNGFIDHLQMITTSNCNSLTGLHTLKITVTAAHLKFSVFTSRFLVTDFSNVLRQRP
jgi:hypothetical protein